MIAAVVVTYSAPAATLDRCLASIRAAGGVDRVIVVDTGGLARPADTHAQVVRVDNRGYGAALNTGIDRALADGAAAVALLNDDLVVRPGWLPPLLAELDDGVGAVQPALVNAGSDPATVNSLGVRIGSDGAGTDIADGELHDPTVPPCDLELFTGGAVVLSAAFVRSTGGFDERWFLYYEDVDLARRGAEQGWRYRLVPGSVVEHEGGVSSGSQPERTRELQERNRLWAAFRFESPATIGRALWLSLRRLRHEPRAAHRRALVAGVGGGLVRVGERLRAARHRQRARRTG